MKFFKSQMEAKAWQERSWLRVELSTALGQEGEDRPRYLHTVLLHSGVFQALKAMGVVVKGPALGKILPPEPALIYLSSWVHHLTSPPHAFWLPIFSPLPHLRAASSFLADLPPSKSWTCQHQAGTSNSQKATEAGLLSSTCASTVQQKLKS